MMYLSAPRHAQEQAGKRTFRHKPPRPLWAGSLALGAAMGDASPDPRVRAARSGRTGERMRATVKRLGIGVCWICGEPIDKGLPPTHAMGWTMDHIIPVSLRPDLAEDIGNVREAHRRCNGERGNNVNYQGGIGSSRCW